MPAAIGATAIGAAAGIVVVIVTVVLRPALFQLAKDAFHLIVSTDRVD